MSLTIYSWVYISNELLFRRSALVHTIYYFISIFPSFPLAASITRWKKQVRINRQIDYGRIERAKNKNLNFRVERAAFVKNVETHFGLDFKIDGEKYASPNENRFKTIYIQQSRLMWRAIATNPWRRKRVDTQWMKKK